MVSHGQKSCLGFLKVLLLSTKKASWGSEELSAGTDLRFSIQASWGVPSAGAGGAGALGLASGPPRF